MPSSLRRPFLQAVVAALLLWVPAFGAEPARDLDGDPLPSGAVVRIGSLRFRHPSAVECAAFSPDGRYIATGGMGASTVQIMETDTGKVIRRLPGHDHPVSAVSFSPDSRRLATCGGDGKVDVWDVAKGERVFRVGTNLGEETLTYLPDGKTLIADAGCNIRLLNADTGEVGKLLIGHTEHVCHIAVSPDGKRLASCAKDGTVRLWDLASGEEERFFRVVPESERGWGVYVAFSADGRLLACRAFDTLFVFDAATGKERWRERLPERRGASVVFAPDGSVLYPVHDSLCMRDGATGKQKRRFDIPEGTRGLILSPDGRTAALTFYGDDGVVLRFDLVKGRLLPAPDGHAHGVRGLAFSPDGRSLVTISREGVFRLWDPATGRLRQTFDGYARIVAFAPDGRALATAAPFEGVSLWDVASGERVHHITVDDSLCEPSGIAFTPQPRYRVACGVGARLVLWDAATGERYHHSFEARRSPILSFNPPLHFALAPDGKTVALVPELGTDAQVVLWDIPTGKVVRETGVIGSPRAFSPDGRLLAIDVTGHVSVLDPVTGREVVRLGDESNCATGVAFSPDGRMIATGQGDGTVRLWETATGKQRRCFTGHRNSVSCVAFSPDGKRLASGSDDLTVLLWDVYDPAPAR
jgi:WD40 repeat protein